VSDTESVARGWYAAFNAGRFEEALAILADDVTWARPPDVPITGTVTGRDEVMRLWRAATDRLESFEIEPTSISVHGNQALARITLRGEPGGGGSPFEFAGAHVITVEDGVIASVLEFRSLPEAEAALGGG
jgi:ketosteroid isomerase-like protein